MSAEGGGGWRVAHVSGVNDALAVLAVASFGGKCLRWAVDTASRAAADEYSRLAAWPIVEQHKTWKQKNWRVGSESAEAIRTYYYYAITTTFSLVPLPLRTQHPAHTRQRNTLSSRTMAVVSLPLTFNNSFWTQDYRKGLEILYGKLEQVCRISWAFLVLTGLCAGRRGE